MKELSTEEKAKRYDEAIEKAKYYYDEGKTLEYADNIASDIFPELKESKESWDEKIRKEILAFAQDRKAKYSNDPKYVNIDAWIDWLEKQGNLMKALQISNARIGELIEKNYYLKEQLEKQVENNMGISEATKQELEDNLNKALEKETPESCNEFLEEQGEQKSNANCLLSWSEIDEKMFQSLEGIVKDYWAKAEQEKNEIKIREASNVSYFLKTIQKSPLCWIKCSDGLPNRDGIYLVVTDGLYNKVYDMARYDSIEGWHKASEVIYWMPIPQLNNKSIIKQKPAEEYNITGIGSKHAEGKLGEMIKNLNPVNEVLEQNPTNKIQPKFKIGDVVRLKYGDGLEWLVKEKHEDGNYTIACADRDDFVLLDDKWELAEQKSSWSEEDEKTYQSIMDDTVQENQLDSKQIEWLKSLKDRVQSQPKQEWSEDDEYHLDSTVSTLEEYAKTRQNEKPFLGVTLDNISWLKLLKNRYTWKPSDLQIECLSDAIKDYNSQGYTAPILKELLDVLKKLKE